MVMDTYLELLNMYCQHIRFNVHVISSLISQLQLYIHG
jgi:hypothetical protein